MRNATVLLVGVSAWAVAIALMPGCDVEDSPEAGTCDADAGLALYTQRVAPILADDRPKSCNQCHLSGVDLSLFVRDTPCQTMACLQQQELVDFSSPEDSLVLAWISRASPDSELITEEVIQAEYDAFLEWIEFYATCSDEVCESFDDPCGLSEKQPTCDSADIEEGFDDPGGCEDIVLEEMFRDAFYTGRGRCFPCHYTGDVKSPDNAPKWLEVEGECNAASLTTMRNVLDSYVDLDAPANSLILLKPLSEEYGGIEHGGGDKFHDTDEASYVALLDWIERTAECREEL